MSNVCGTVHQRIFDELLKAGIAREDLAMAMIDVASELYGSLHLVPRFRKEAGELVIDIVVGDASRPFDEVLVQINDAALLAEIGYTQKHSAPLDDSLTD
jgi:hypothetical protein